MLKGQWISLVLDLCCFNFIENQILCIFLLLASRVITDQTELRKIKCMEKTGISITRELMWWWGVRLATVQQLLEVLSELQFYRAAKTITDCE